MYRRVPEPEEEPARTEVITPNYEDTEIVASASAEDLIDDDASEIDLGMDETTSLLASEPDETGELNLETGELALDIGDEDDDEDISIIDFGGDDFVEPTDVVESVDATIRVESAEA